MEPSLSAEAYLRGRLTPAQARHFAEEGWLLVTDALPAADAAELSRLLDGMREAKLAEGRLPSEIIAQAAFSETNDLQHHQVLDRLLTAPSVFPKVVDVLGANIRVYHSHFNWTPPHAASENGDEAEPEPSDYSRAKTLGFHQDSHRLNVELGHNQPDGPRPRISLKCAFFLSDCSQPGRANTWIVPKLHLSDSLPPLLPLQQGGDGAPGTGQPAGAMPVLAPANSCLIFDRRLWHTGSPNWSAFPRKVCFVGYAPRWMKPRDAMWVEPAMARTQCPIVRQLLGATTSMAGNYPGGNKYDVPLYGFLHSIGVKEGIGINQPQSFTARLSAALSESTSAGLEGDVGQASYPRNPARTHLPLGPVGGGREAYKFPSITTSDTISNTVRVRVHNKSTHTRHVSHSSAHGTKMCISVMHG